MLRGHTGGSGVGCYRDIFRVWQLSLQATGLTTEINSIVGHTVYTVFTNYLSLLFGPIIDH